MTTATSTPADRFFESVLGTAPPVTESITSILVAHVLPSQPPFLQALSNTTRIAAVVPKPNSAQAAVRRQVEMAWLVDDISRRELSCSASLVEFLERRAAGQSVVLLDVGGYFSPGLPAACEEFSGQILGVVEDTENGLRRYEAQDKLPCAVYSVARSPLKEAEDRLVGESIVFSTEALLRTTGDVLPGRRACVIGYGKIGSSIARALHGRHVPVTVVEQDPVRLIQALSAGYAATERLHDALPGSDLVFCATGNHSLSAEDMLVLREDCAVASATSADDELDLEGLSDLCEREQVSLGVTRYRSLKARGRGFRLLNDGNAVNFLHGSALGPAIHLVQAEVLAALTQLAAVPHPPGLFEVTAQQRHEIAALWLRAFQSDALCTVELS